jgi:hypothetical protein
MSSADRSAPRVSRQRCKTLQRASWAPSLRHHRPARHQHSTFALLCEATGPQPRDPASCSRAPPPQPPIVAHPPGHLVWHFAVPPASSSPLPPPAMSAPSQHQRWARGQGRRAQATARGRIGSRRHPQTQRQNCRGTAHVPSSVESATGQPSILAGTTTTTMWIGARGWRLASAAVVPLFFQGMWPSPTHPLTGGQPNATGHGPWAAVSKLKFKT